MNEDKYQKWVKWIQIIVIDVTIMLRNRFVYNGVQSIIAANANLHQSNVFYDCFNKLYVDSVTMGIRRQLDVHYPTLLFLSIFVGVFTPPKS